MQQANLTHCASSMLVLRDALEVVSGKWKLLILVSLATGHHRFREIERSIPDISSKVLAKELKDLEQHELIKRTVQEGPPVLVTYELLPYADTLDPVIFALREWGGNHRQKIMRQEVAASRT
jgi:DNA-binding HxlR family transcriptional regulator